MHCPDAIPQNTGKNPHCLHCNCRQKLEQPPRNGQFVAADVCCRRRHHHVQIECKSNIIITVAAAAIC